MQHRTLTRRRQRLDHLRRLHLRHRQSHEHRHRHAHALRHQQLHRLTRSNARCRSPRFPTGGRPTAASVPRPTSPLSSLREAALQYTRLLHDRKRLALSAAQRRARCLRHGLLTFSTPVSVSFRTQRRAHAHADGKPARDRSASSLADNTALTSLTKAGQRTGTSRRQHLHRRHDAHAVTLHLGSSCAIGSSGTISFRRASAIPASTQQRIQSLQQPDPGLQDLHQRPSVDFSPPDSELQEVSRPKPASGTLTLSGQHSIGGTTISAASCNGAAALLQQRQHIVDNAVAHLQPQRRAQLRRRSSLALHTPGRTARAAQLSGARTMAV